MPIKHDYNGALIVFEGIDGAGTTTQAELYAKHVLSRRRMATARRHAAHLLRTVKAVAALVSVKQPGFQALAPATGSAGEPVLVHRVELAWRTAA